MSAAKLTEAQRKALAAIAASPDHLDSWGFGSGTISSLRKLGLIAKQREEEYGRVVTVNVITDAGRAALAEAGK